MRNELSKAAKLLADGDLRAAEKIAEAVLEQGDDAEALHLLGLVRARQNNLTEAIVLVARSIKTKPRQPDVLLSFGRLLALLGQNDSAVAAFSEATSVNPDFGDAWFELGNQQHQLGQLEAAEASYRRFLQLVPAHGPALLALGALLLNAGRPGEAESILTAAFEAASDAHLAGALAYNLSFAQRALGKKSAALESLDRSRQSQAVPADLDLTRANLLEEMLRFDEALGVLESMLERAPLDVRIHSAYNDLLYRLGRDEDFLKSYDRVRDTPALQLEKGRFLLAARRGQDAHATFAAVLARDPLSAEAASGLAAALNQLERHGEAVAVLEQTVQKYPQKPSLFLELAAAALLDRDPQKAAVMGQKGFTAAPDDQLAIALLGTAWRMMGDEREHYINDYEGLIGVFDLEPPDGFADMQSFNLELQHTLDRQHPKTREFITQSARGGTQTRGNIFGSGQRLVDLLQCRITQAVQRYVAGLGEKKDHPFTSRRRNDFTYGGSWSSQLRDGGFHVNHIHPAGWISSCYYVAVPDAARDPDAKQGWIKFGEPGLALGLPMRRAIQPVPGRLVLFPSYFWHGTMAFGSPEPRTTLAFDAIPH